jgi:hypothetical protein
VAEGFAEWIGSGRAWDSRFLALLGMTNIREEAKELEAKGWKLKS